MGPESVQAVSSLSHAVIAVAPFDLDPAIVARLDLLAARDETASAHSLAVGALMARFARHLKMDPASVALLELGGLLHDIGKTDLSMAVLNKPGHLTADEMADVRSHPARGHHFLAQFDALPAVVLDICLHHHERLDGTGYPDGRTAAQISLPVRIATICDVYDALISPRQYKPAWAAADAAAWMMDADGFFDRDLLGQFLDLVSPQQRRHPAILETKSA